MNRRQTSLRANTGANQEQKKPNTDWLAWSLQWVLGFVVGFGASFSIARILYRSGFISFNQMFLIMIGGACCCGAFASCYGDRAWMRLSIFNSSGPRRTESSRKWSMLTGSFGALLIFAPIVLHLMAVGGPPAGHARGGRFFTLLLAAIPGFLLFHALRTGAGFWRFGTLDRTETPLFFWIYVSGMALGIFCLLFGR